MGRQLLITNLAYLSNMKFSRMNQVIWKMTSREREAMQQLVWSKPPGYTRAVVRLIRLAITVQVV